MRGDKEKANVKHAALAGVAEGKHPSRHRCNRSGGEAAHIEEEIKRRMKNPIQRITANRTSMAPTHRRSTVPDAPRLPRSGLVRKRSE